MQYTPKVSAALDSVRQIFYTDTMTAANEEPAQQTEWHRLFAVEQDLALTPVGVGVEAEFPAMTESPWSTVIVFTYPSLRKKSSC